MKARLFAVVCLTALVIVSVAPGRSGPARVTSDDDDFSPQAQASVQVLFGATGLQPGDRYGARFVAEFADGHTYTLGYGDVAVKTDGGVSFRGVTMEDLAYMPGSGPIRSVEACLLPGGWWRAWPTPPPVADAEGRLICAETYIAGDS